MNIFLKISLGIALALPLSASITMVNDVAEALDAPSSFKSLTKVSPAGLAHSMTGEQLAATQGMAGICISCLDKTTIERLAQALGQHGNSTVDGTDSTEIQLSQFVGAGPVTQSNHAMINQTMINQTFSPSNQQLSVVSIQQNQILATQFPNEQQVKDLAQEIIVSTQEVINQNLQQLTNVVQPVQSPIRNGQRSAEEIINSTQELINQANRNGAANTATINQQFLNTSGGGFLR